MKKLIIWFIGVLAVITLFAFATPWPLLAAEQKKEALIILPVVGSSPVCVDTESCTPEELEAIATWQVAYDNLWGLYGKIQKNQGWLLKGPHYDIIYPGKGVLVEKAGQLGTAAWFKMNRIDKDDPTQWFIDKVAAMRANGWIFRGYATDDPHQEFIDRNYEVVGSDE